MITRNIATRRKSSPKPATNPRITKRKTEDANATSVSPKGVTDSVLNACADVKSEQVNVNTIVKTLNETNKQTVKTLNETKKQTVKTPTVNKKQSMKTQNIIKKQTVKTPHATKKQTDKTDNSSKPNQASRRIVSKLVRIAITGKTPMKKAPNAAKTVQRKPAARRRTKPASNATKSNRSRQTAAKIGRRAITKKTLSRQDSVNSVSSSDDDVLYMLVEKEQSETQSKVSTSTENQSNARSSSKVSPKELSGKANNSRKKLKLTLDAKANCSGDLIETPDTDPEISFNKEPPSTGKKLLLKDSIKPKSGKFLNFHGPLNDILCNIKFMSK